MKVKPFVRVFTVILIITLSGYPNESNANSKSGYIFPSLGVDRHIYEIEPNFHLFNLRISIKDNDTKGTSPLYRLAHFNAPDTRIGIRIGTKGLFMLLGINEYYSTYISLEPFSHATSKVVELLQDIRQDEMELYQFKDGSWSMQPIYMTGDLDIDFIEDHDNILLMVHGIFTGDYLEWTNAAAYLVQHDPSLHIYAVDYGTGYTLEQLGKWLGQIIDKGIGDNTRITILAHSQGGLISRVALELNMTFPKKVQRLITLGTPHEGVYYGTVVTNLAKKIKNIVPELNDLQKTSRFMEKLNHNIEVASIEYYFVAGTDRGRFSGYWNLADKLASEDLVNITNDGVVEKTSALGEGLNLNNKLLKFDYAEFPIDHSAIMHDQKVLAQVLEWLQ